MIRKLINIILIVFAMISMGYSQQLPNHNLYTSNIYSINPAFASINSYNEIFLDHKQQWTGFDQSPSTTYINSNFGIGNLTGVGANLMLDKIGLVNNLHLDGSFSKGIAFKEHKLAAGIGIGIQQISVDFENAIADDYTDNVFTETSNNAYSLYNSVGLFYSYKKFQIGLSSPYAYPTTVNDPYFNFSNERKFNLFTSYKIKLSEKTSLSPSVMAKAINEDMNQVDINLDLHLNNMFLIGATARTDNSLSARLGAQIKERIQLSYSFERKRVNSSNLISHEIALAFRIKRKEKEVPIKDSIIPFKVDSIILIYKDANDSIIEHRFINIEALNDFTIRHEVKDYTIKYLVDELLHNEPELKVFDLVNSQDTLYIIEIEDSTGQLKKHRFVFVKHIEDYEMDIKRKNPILSARIKHEMEAHPEFKVIHVFAPEYDHYDVTIIDTTTHEEKKFRFQTIEQLNNYMLRLEDKYPVLHQKVMNQIYEHFDVNMFEVEENTLMQEEKEVGDEPKIDEQETKPDAFQEAVQLARSMDIEFVFNSSDYHNEANINKLKTLADLLIQSNAKIVITGHTCDIGSENVNYTVGLTRAKQIAEILIKNGVQKSKINTRSSGDKSPLVPNDSDANRAKNRRVVLEVKH